MFIFIIIMIILLCIIYFSKKKNKILNNNLKNNSKFDIVITWVRNDTAFQNEKNIWKTKYNMINQGDERYTDNKEIVYLLRSIDKYLNDYNNIYIVVKDSQFPEYLNFKHPKLILIKHSEIIPSQFLPTFNSMVIEAFLHKIPNLTDNYLYFNDDVILMSNKNAAFFIDNYGIPYSLHENNNEYNCITMKNIDINNYEFTEGWCFNLELVNNILNQPNKKRYFVSHNPKMFNKKFDNQIENILKKYYYKDDKINIFDKNAASKFRLNSNLYLVSLLKEVLYHELFNSKYKKCNNSIITNFDENTKLNNNYDFMCIQNIKDINNYKNELERHFSYKSQFEL